MREQEGEWQNIKENMMHAAKSFLKTGYKNEVCSKWIQTGLAKDLERYRQKGKEINIYGKKKKEVGNEIMKDIEMNSRDYRKLS